MSLLFPNQATGDSSKPLVSLGLPVYNGGNFLQQALDSILAQTYPNWELIISDNGSADATQDICRAYAARDGRIRYHREDSNRGATWNFNRVFELAKGEFFRWTAHDDVCAPQYLERCMAVLLENPNVVLCHSRTRIIGPRDEVQEDYAIKLRMDSARVGERFHDLICVDHSCFEIFGVMRSGVLAKTPGLESTVGADRNLLAELALHGPFQEVPEYLFMRRDHPDTSTRRYPSPKDRIAWFRNAPNGDRFHMAHRAVGYWHSILRSPLGIGDRLVCHSVLLKWVALRLRSFFFGHNPTFANFPTKIFQTRSLGWEHSIRASTPISPNQPISRSRF